MKLTQDLKNIMIKNGVTVIVIPNKKHNGTTIDYRVFKSKDVFVSITKYQALKYMTQSQKDNLSLYEEVKRLMDPKQPIKDRIENNRIIKDRNKNDTRFYTMYDLIKNLRYTEL
jgi:hypothetical protein